jgi:hypothetical protein
VPCSAVIDIDSHTLAIDVNVTVLLTVWLPLDEMDLDDFISTENLAPPKIKVSFKRTRGWDTISYPNPHRTSPGMSQPYHLPDSPPNSTNTRTVPIGMTNPGSQSTAVENNPSAERFGSGEEVQNLAATAVALPTGENEVWQRDTQSQNEWIPGFGKMVSKIRPLI